MSDLIKDINWSWPKLALLVLVVTLVYFALRFARRFVDVGSFLPDLRMRLKAILRIILILYEPVSVFLVAFGFIFIEPVEFGAMVLLLLVATFPHIKNYLSGRMLLLENSFSEGDVIVAEGERGTVIAMGRLGVKLGTESGLRHISYRQLVENGWKKTEDRTAGNVYRLEVQMEGEEQKRQFLQRLNAAVLASPYPDFQFAPQLDWKEGDNRVVVRLRLRNRSHLLDLAELLQERGYQCQPNFS